MFRLPNFYTGVDDSVIFYAKYQNYGTSRIPPRVYFVTDRMADELQFSLDALGKDGLKDGVTR